MGSGAFRGVFFSQGGKPVGGMVRSLRMLLLTILYRGFRDDGCIVLRLRQSLGVMPLVYFNRHLTTGG